VTESSEINLALRRNALAFELPLTVTFCAGKLSLRSFVFLEKIMKLTRRQETFVHSILDLYRESNGPIHYSVLAAKIGVSPFTAYDMVRVLEKKGLVSIEYSIDNSKPIVGRSEVFFRPTESAHQLVAELAGDAYDGNWEEVKSQIVANIKAGGLRDDVIAEEFLARVPPDAPDALRYCIEVISIVVLRLGKGTGRQVLAKHLPQLIEWQGTITRSGLMLLAGFVLGLLANEKDSDTEWYKLFLENIKRYESLVMGMEPRMIRKLGDTMKDVLSPLFHL
jgi:DNA-binding MarR family transcriptional regulator